MAARVVVSPIHGRETMARLVVTGAPRVLQCRSEGVVGWLPAVPPRR